jgi:hypothetical protein
MLRPNMARIALESILRATNILFVKYNLSKILLSFNMAVKSVTIGVKIFTAIVNYVTSL